MKRRDFIKLSANAALVLAFAGLGSPLCAAGNVTTPKTVVNLMLDGGPDFRHLIVPVYALSNNDSNSYAAKFWNARASLWGVSSTEDLKKAFSDNYDEFTLGGEKYGILKKCAWLKDEITAGNVAIVNNVIGSTNRDHHHSQIIMERGYIDANSHSLDASGWAGRAAKSLSANVLSLSTTVRLVCNGPHATDVSRHDNSCVISNYYSRDTGLVNYDTQADLDEGNPRYKWSEEGIMSRSLSSYYSAKAPHVPTSSVFRKPIEHEIKVRNFGIPLEQRLDETPIPTSIANLAQRDHPNELDSSTFAHQIQALYDSYATQDILNMRLASLDYTGWDSHKNLRTQIEPKFEDIFGRDRGLESLFTESTLLKSDCYANSVVVVSGEFGRQLKSNGDHGNDHGRGNTVLVIGKSVNGGMYGDPFPEYEKEFLEVKNRDIEGKTSLFKVYAEVLNWQENELGTTVFGDLSSHDVEDGVDLGRLFS